jgi:hypothetical protein
LFWASPVNTKFPEFRWNPAEIFFLGCIMAARSGSGSSGGGSLTGEDDAHVTDLMERLNLTKDEEEFAAFSYNEDA